MYPPEQLHEILTRDREGILALIEQSRYITLLPLEKRGKYLIGTARNNRAICLAWGNDPEDGKVTYEVLKAAYREIAEAGLCVPFLFFCRMYSVLSSDLFTAMQIPIVFENRAILPALRTLNLHGLPHVAPKIEENDGNCSE